MDFWQSELTEEEADRMIEQCSDAILARKLQAPAVAMLEMHKPLGFLAGHAALAFSPFIVPFFGFDSVNDYSRLLKDRSLIERLIQRIEEKSAQTTLAET